MLRFERTLPGEWQGTIRPEEYAGVSVFREEPPSPEEVYLRIAKLYRQVLERTGVRIPQFDRFLALESFDSAPAQALVTKHDALSYPYTTQFGIADLEIDEGVFCPTLTNVSPFLLWHIDFKPKERVLDAFSGSGAFGINAAIYGAANVVAFDISDKAVACAKKNALRNEVSERVEVRRGTLQETLFPDEQFDLIIANPPLLPDIPTSPFETALFDSGLQATTDLIASLPTHLARKGRCYLLTSDVIDRNVSKVDISGHCSQLGLKLSTVAEQHLKYETYRVHKIEKKRFSGMK